MTRLPGLDLLRAIAIVWVMLFHSFLVGGLGPDFEWLSRYGWMGVDIFFVLSGFLIGTQVFRELQQTRTLALGRFYAKRAWRILPAYGVVLAVYALAPGWREEPGLQPWWQFATFTVNLLIDYGHNTAFSHAWSLSVEEHFYWVFPLAALGLWSRLSARGLIALALLLVVGGVAGRGGIWLHDTAVASSRPWFIEDLYYPTWCRLDGLLMGVMLAALRVCRPALWQRGLGRSPALLALGLLLLALAMALTVRRASLVANTAGWPLISAGFALLVWAACDERSVLARLRLPGVGWMAAVSYSVYLSHKLAFQFVHTQLLPWLGWEGFAQFPVYALAVLLVGAALHYGVERPGLWCRDRLLGTPHPSVAPAAA